MPGKRQKEGKKKPHGQKRQKTEDNYEDGESGFLVTSADCQSALRGLKDLRLWLDVEVEPESNEADPLPVAVSSSTGLDAELAELKEGGKQGRFLSVGMVCKGVAFLKTQHESDVPSDAVLKILGKGVKNPFVSRFADRVWPVDRSCRPKKDEFSSLAQTVLERHRGKTWRLVYEQFRGGWNTISQEDALAACKTHLSAELLSVSEPEVTVLCTVQPRFVGLAAVRLDIDDLEVTFKDE